MVEVAKVQMHYVASAAVPADQAHEWLADGWRILPDLGTAATLTRAQLEDVAVALGLDPNTVGSLRLDADAVTITSWDEVAHAPTIRVVPVRDADGEPV